MALIQFVQNYDDLSNSTGFQFKFYCDRCHNGYMSNFEPNRTNATEGILRSAGGLLDGLFGKAAENMQNKCGAAASGGKFCQECGAPLGPQPCKGCGASLAPNSKFCSECGAPST